MGSTSSQESAESQSRSAPGCEPSLTVSRTDTLSQFYFQDNPKGNCTERQSGMMCKRSPDQCCRQLTLFSEAFPARISALREMVSAWRESEAVYSTKLSGSQKKLERRLCSSKTSQRLELADFVKSSEHLPKSGMTVGGRVYQPQALELHTKENGGSYLPTSTAQSYGSNQGGSAGRSGKVRHSLESMAKKNLWPTPRANDAEKRGQFDIQNPRNGLPAAVKRWPTPCARDWKDSPGQKYRGQRDENKLAPQVYLVSNGGQLNPTWVEWLMGYTLEHTELNALGTQWFHSKSEKRSERSRELETSA